MSTKIGLRFEKSNLSVASIIMRIWHSLSINLTLSHLKFTAENAELEVSFISGSAR